MSFNMFIGFFISTTIMLASLFPFVVYMPMIEKNPIFVLALVPHFLVFAVGFKPAYQWMLISFTSLLEKIFAWSSK